MMWQNLEQNEDLSTLWKSVWTELKTSLVRRGHPWRTPCLCTQSADGPQGRTVVLRRVLPSLGAVRFHTDGRSSKIDEAHSNMLYVPTTLVSMNCLGLSIERSTCVSAARCITAFGLCFSKTAPNAV